ncbi:hypothetical protein [Nocardia sp. NPDC004260]
MNKALFEVLRDLRGGLADVIRKAGTAKAGHLINTSRETGGAARRYVDADHRGAPAVNVAWQADAGIGGQTRHRTAAYVPDPAEIALRELRFRKPNHEDRLTPFEKGKNTVHIVRGSDGERYVFKPVRGEKLGLRDAIPSRPGEYAKREVAAYRVDRLLGFGLVPPTTFATGPKRIGRGSVQKFVPSSEAEIVESYPEGQRERMAVLDYVIGNTDRRYGNFRTVKEHDCPANERKVLAIDHGLAFPETAHAPSYGFFHESYGGKPIGEEVMASLRAVDQEQLRAALRDTDLSTSAIAGTLDRLNHLLYLGHIPEPRWGGNVGPG